MRPILFVLSSLVTRDDIPLPLIDKLGANTVSRILTLVFGVAGGIALVLVTIGGFKYVLSQGNPQETAKAKNTIVYALIGLVVVMVAFSIVRFVVNHV